MADISVARTDTRTDTGTKARDIATIDFVDGEGELRLSKVSDTLSIVGHTGVPDSMRGIGIAKVLAERLIAYGRSGGQRIVPLCPVMRADAQKHREETSDVIQW